MILKSPNTIESVTKGLTWQQKAAVKNSRVTVHRVSYRIFVGPSNGRADFYRESVWNEGVIGHINRIARFRSCFCC